MSYDILFAGELAPGADHAQVRARLQGLFRLSDEAAVRLFSGQPLALKRGLDQAQAERLRQVFLAAGAVARLVEQPASSLTAAVALRSEQDGSVRHPGASAVTPASGSGSAGVTPASVLGPAGVTPASVLGAAEATRVSPSGAAKVTPARGLGAAEVTSASMLAANPLASPDSPASRSASSGPLSSPPLPSSSSPQGVNWSLAAVDDRPLESAPDYPPPAVDISRLHLVTGQDWSLEDCNRPSAPAAVPDISHLRILEQETELSS